MGSVEYASLPSGTVASAPLLEEGSVEAARAGLAEIPSKPTGSDNLQLLAPLDGIRGVSSVLVVVGHLFTFWTPTFAVDGSSPWPWPLVGVEYLSAVTMFFLISGFCLSRVYERGSIDPTAPSPLATAEQRSTFFRRRVARLAPVYYCSLLIALPSFLAYNWGDAFTIATSSLFTLLWVQSITIVGNSWNGPLWTASAFVFCYLAYPRIYSSLRLASPRKLAWGLAGLALLSIVLEQLWVGLLGFGGLIFALHAFAPFRLIHFVMGVCAGLLGKQWVPSRPTLLAEACSLVLLANQVLCALVSTKGVGAMIYYSYVMEFALPGVHALWLIALTSPGCSGVTRAILLSPPLSALGAVSYALYCCHWPMIQLTSFALANRGISAAAVPFVTRDDIGGWFNIEPKLVPVVVLVCFVVATIVHLALERPARKALRK